MAEVVVLLNDAAISRLAREIAREIKPLHEVLKEFQLSAEQFDVIADNNFFQTRLTEETQLWNASDPVSIRGRIETKSATMLEDMLLEAYTLFHDRNQPLAAKVEMLKFAARISGLGDNAQKVAEGGGVKITINVGSKSIEFDKEKSTLPGGVTDVVDLTPGNA